MHGALEGALHEEVIREYSMEERCMDEAPEVS